MVDKSLRMRILENVPGDIMLVDYKIHKSLRIVTIAVFISLVLFQSNACSWADDQRVTIKIGGTGGAIGAMKELAEAFQKKHPSVRIVFVPNLGTRGGIKAVAEGAIDIGISGRALTAAELSQGLKQIEYARSPFVFVTSRNGAGINLTPDMVMKIYRGEIKTWPDGTRIRIILRPDGDGDTIMLKAISSRVKDAVGTAQSREGMITAITDQDSADHVEKIKGSFGTSTLTQIISEKREVTMLPFNGVMPGVETAVKGAYPFSKPFVMITGPNCPPVARGFAGFVGSPEGRAILTKTGNLVPKGK